MENSPVKQSFQNNRVARAEVMSVQLSELSAIAKETNADMLVFGEYEFFDYNKTVRIKTHLLIRFL